MPAFAGMTTERFCCRLHLAPRAARQPPRIARAFPLAFPARTQPAAGALMSRTREDRDHGAGRHAGEDRGGGAHRRRLRRDIAGDQRRRPLAPLLRLGALFRPLRAPARDPIRGPVPARGLAPARRRARRQRPSRPRRCLRRRGRAAHPRLRPAGARAQGLAVRHDRGGRRPRRRPARRARWAARHRRAGGRGAGVELPAGRSRRARGAARGGGAGDRCRERCVRGRAAGARGLLRHAERRAEGAHRARHGSPEGAGVAQPERAGGSGFAPGFGA